MTTRPTEPPASLYLRSAPFVLPFVIFMILLEVGNSFVDQHYLFYPVKALAVALALAWYWRALPTLKPSALLASIAVGVIGIVLWVGLDSSAHAINLVLEGGFNRVADAVGLTSCEVKLEKAMPAGRDPFVLYPAGEAWTLFALRVLGISVCVPIMEELFWRGFLMRWLIRDDFTSVPMGAYQPFSFWTVTGLFALEHGSEWLLGLVAGAIFGAWLVRTKNLGNVMLAHGVTNLLLALYCLFSGDWHFLSALSPSSAAR